MLYFSLALTAALLRVSTASSDACMIDCTVNFPNLFTLSTATSSSWDSPVLQDLRAAPAATTSGGLSAKLVKRSPTPVLGTPEPVFPSTPFLETHALPEKASAQIEEGSLDTKGKERDLEIDALDSKKLSKELGKVREYMAELGGLEGISERVAVPMIRAGVAEVDSTGYPLLEDVSPEMKLRYWQAQAHRDAETDALLDKISSGTHLELKRMKNDHSNQLRKVYNSEIESIKKLQDQLEKLNTKMTRAKDPVGKAAEIEINIRRHAWGAHLTVQKLQRWYQELHTRYGKLYRALERSQS